MLFRHHRAVLVVCLGAAVIAAAVVAGALSASARQAGSSLTWGPAPAAGTASPSAAATGVPVPQASPSPTAAASLGGLQLPLSGLFQQLNSETQNTAVGQWAILRDIGDAIRDHIVAFLRWISRKR